MDLLSASGDSFEKLCVGLRRQLFNHARRLSHDGHVAEDVVQDAMVRAWKAWPRWTPGAAEPQQAARAWLYAITTNVFLNYVDSDKFRRNARLEHRDEIIESTHGGEVEILPKERSSEPGDAAAGTNSLFHRHGAPALQDVACDRALADEVAQALRHVREPYRDWIQRYYFKGQDCVEIGAQTGHSASTVSRGLHRARVFLRPLLKSFAAANYGLVDRTRVDVPAQPAKVVKAKPRRVQRVVRKHQAVPLLVS